MSNTFSAQDYYRLLETEPKTIESLLEYFGLPATSSGRQKFRDANSAFNKEFDGRARIVGAWVDVEGKSRKAFKVEVLTPNTNEASVS
jgi:methionine synthase II (cobalamin-independent)